MSEFPVRLTDYDQPIFSKIRPEIYEQIYNLLEDLRRDHPGTRDEHLLMYALCQLLATGIDSWRIQ